jgi:copper chaperone CopZ
MRKYSTKNNKTRRVDIRVSEKELQQIDKQAAKANMSRSEFLIAAAIKKQINVVEGGKEVAYHLSKIGGSINHYKKLVLQDRVKVVYFDKFAEEVHAVWLLWSSSINGTEATRE